MSKSCSILLIVLCPIPSVTLSGRQLLCPIGVASFSCSPARAVYDWQRVGRRYQHHLYYQWWEKTAKPQHKSADIPLGVLLRLQSMTVHHQGVQETTSAHEELGSGHGPPALLKCTSLAGSMETLLACGKAAPRWLQACTMLMSGDEDSGCTQELVQEGTSHEQQCMVHEEPQWCTTTLQKAGPPFCPLKWLSGRDRVCGKDAQSNHWEGFQLLRENTSHSHPAPEQNISRQIAAVRE